MENSSQVCKIPFGSWGEESEATKEKRRTRLGTIYNRIGTESTSENATPCWSRYFRLHDQALDTVDDLFMAIARFGLSDQYLQVRGFSLIRKNKASDSHKRFELNCLLPVTLEKLL